MKKIIVAFGTRPEAIKLAPLILELRRQDSIEVLVCVTGQHREMLDQALKVFGLVPDIDFNVMRENQNLDETFSTIFLSFGQYIRIQRPDLVIVHGDTTTAAAVAQSSFFHNIDIAHVEAGLRTHDLTSPFPEEFNRQIISRVARFHFAPTSSNVLNLKNEGIEPGKIFLSGNTVVDALGIIKREYNFETELGELRLSNLRKLIPFDFQNSKYILITAHRRENFGQGLVNICSSISELAKEMPNFNFVFPVHLNPNVQSVVRRILDGLPNVFLIDPLDYFDFLILLSHCFFVMSDSGGIQEEAPSFGKKLILLRENTERPEAIANGVARMVGTEKSAILNACREYFTSEGIGSFTGIASNPFGDGMSSKRIVRIILENLHLQSVN